MTDADITNSKYSTALAVILPLFTKLTMLPSRILLFDQAGSHSFRGRSGRSSSWLHDSPHAVVGQYLALVCDSAPRNQWRGVVWDSQRVVSWLSPSFRSSAAASSREHGQTTATTHQYFPFYTIFTSSNKCWTNSPHKYSYTTSFNIVNWYSRVAWAICWVTKALHREVERNGSVRSKLW